MVNIPQELIVKAKSAKSTEELLVLAKDNNVALTETEAKTYFEQLNGDAPISDDELDMVAGGCGDDTSKEENETATADTLISGDDGICPTCSGGNRFS